MIIKVSKSKRVMTISRSEDALLGQVVSIGFFDGTAKKYEIPHYGDPVEVMVRSLPSSATAYKRLGQRKVDTKGKVIKIELID